MAKTISKRQYTNSDIQCPVCQRWFKSPQALRGHLRFTTCGDKVEGFPQEENIKRWPSGSDSPSQGIKGLEYEIKRLELERKIRELAVSAPQQAHKIPDMAEQAGLGTMTEPIRTEVQSRAFGVSEHQNNPGLVDLLKSPNLPIILKAARGALGVQEGGSDTLDILEKLGLNLRELIELARRGEEGVKAPAGLKVGSIDLQGISLTPELLGIVLKHQDSQQRYAYERERDSTLMDGIQDLGALVKSYLEDRAVAKTNGAGISAEAKAEAEAPGEILELVCPECQTEFTVNMLDYPPGSVIECPNEECPVTWPIVSRREAMAQERTWRKEAANQPEPVTLECSCGQLLDISGLEIGSKIRCPLCEQETTIISSVEALKALPTE